MELERKPFPVTQRASVSDAKLAYFEGDFERCLEICANIRVRTLATASEIALLSARAFLRTGRPREAQAAIADSLETHVTLDASVTAQMLSANAFIRQGDADRGIALLAEAASRAAGAHVAIQSEIAFSTALGYWAKREIETAQAFLERVDPRSDIIHARALELKAWCYTAQRDYRKSADAFRSTLARLDECQAGDRAIAATAVSTIAIFAAELFDREMARLVELRAKNMEWSSGLNVQRYLTLTHQALFAEFTGNTVEAYEYASLAQAHAPTIAFEALALALLSTIARNAGETHSAILYGQRARASLATLDARELKGEERFAMLGVADCCAHFDADTSADLFARYWGLAPVDRMVSLAGDPRLTADETYIEGVVAQARNELVRAERCYRTSYEIFKGIGYVRRACVAGHALLRLAPGDGDVRVYVRTAVAGTGNYIDNALAGQAAGDDRTASLERHPIVAALSPGQREVVALVCLGKSNKEIARSRGVGEQTIKNTLTKHIFPAFGVSSRAALVSTCLGLRSSGA